MTKTAVLGGGIIGVQIARALQRSGHKTTLYDPKEPGTGTSFGNAGYIATDEIFPLAHSTVLRSLPRMLIDPLGPISINWKKIPQLLPWLVKYVMACTGNRAQEGIAALASLQREAKVAWLDVVKREKISHLMRNNGALKLFETDIGIKRTALERALQQEYGIDWVLESGEQVHKRIPELSDTVKHAVFYPAGMNTISPYGITKTIFENFLSDGGSFENIKVESLDAENPLIVKSAEVRTFYDNVVICCGHLSGQLLEPLGYKVPLVAERGYHVEMDHSELSFDMPVGSYERGCYLTPMLSGLRVAGTSEFVPPSKEPEPNWARAEILQRHVEQLLPGIVLKRESRWVGHRPTLPDFLPVIGPVPNSPGVFAAFGHHHLGLTLSAITATMLLDLMCTTKAHPYLDKLQLDRFQ